MSTVGYRGVYFYNVADTNGNRVVDPAEIAGRTCTDAIAGTGACNYYGFDIDNPGNVADADSHRSVTTSTPMTHEFQFGLDREIAAELRHQRHVHHAELQQLHVAQQRPARVGLPADRHVAPARTRRLAITRCRSTA